MKLPGQKEMSADTIFGGADDFGCRCFRLSNIDRIAVLYCIAIMYTNQKHRVEKHGAFLLIKEYHQLWPVVMIIHWNFQELLCYSRLGFVSRIRVLFVSEASQIVHTGV